VWSIAKEALTNITFDFSPLRVVRKGHNQGQDQLG
jgi:hypothetical protein